MQSGRLGVATHAALAVVAAGEAVHSKSKWRQLLLGCMCGWHLFATVYHLREKPLTKVGQVGILEDVGKS